MESVFNQGWLGGVSIGLTFIVMRKPILSTLTVLSSKIIPESHTREELGYLEMYSLAMKDNNITVNERSMLNLQATAYGIDEERKAYLELWYDDLQRLGESE